MKSQFCFQFHLVMMLMIIFCNIYAVHSGPYSEKFLYSIHGDKNHSATTIDQLSEHASSNNRKLLLHGSCKRRDISISQSKDTTQGIPRYVVQIANTCTSDECAPSEIHLHCGWFSSATLINPNTFKRLSYDDCLVNGGKALHSGQIIRFTYRTTFMYPLAFKSANFC